jgi:hypothetical protein
MRKGMVLYVTEGKEDVPLQGVEDLIETSRRLGVSAVSVATSEDEVVHGWWHLTAKGMHQVMFMSVSYDAAQHVFKSRGTPRRLCG